jgi:hypothetical protein
VQNGLKELQMMKVSPIPAERWSKGLFERNISLFAHGYLGLVCWLRLFTDKD